MNPVTGYYSLIQYCPDLSRLEAANVGVLLFSPAHGFLKALTAEDNRRVRRLFGREGHDWTRLNSFKRGIEERVSAQSSSVRTVEDLERLIARQANRLQITAPRAMRVTDPEKNLRELFNELVGGKSRARQKQDVKADLRKRFEDAGLLGRIRTRIPIHVPTFDREIEFPYGYQNGRFNLIQPARFQTPEPAKAIATACRYAVAGRSLYEHPHPEFGPLQLVVVALFSPAQSESQALVRRVLGEYEVKLFTTADLDRLLADIRENAREIPAEV